MSDITQKPKQENPMDIIKTKELLLIRVESFTSKDLSNACRGMDEKLLERIATMCERIASSGEKPYCAVQTAITLSKKKDCREEILDSIMNHFEQSPDTWSFYQTEKLSQDVSAAQLLKSLPLIERISKWNRGAFPVRIDEEHFVFLTSQLVTALGDQKGLEKCMELGKECTERGINPEDLQHTLVLFIKKHPTHEQFNTVVDELSKLLTLLEPAPHALKNLPDEIQFSTTDEFIKYLKDLNFKNDPSRKAIKVTIDTPKEEELSKVLRIYDQYKGERGDVRVHNTWVAHAKEDFVGAAKGDLVGGMTLEEVLGTTFIRVIGVELGLKRRKIGEQMVSWLSKKITEEGGILAVELPKEREGQPEFYAKLGFKKGLTNEKGELIMEYRP
jgi:hypothetical protein